MGRTLLILLLAVLGSGCSAEFCSWCSDKHTFCGQFVNGGDDEGGDSCGHFFEDKTCEPGKRKRIGNTSKPSGDFKFTAQEAIDHLAGAWLGELYRMNEEDYIVMSLELFDVNHGAWFVEQEVIAGAPEGTECPPYYEIYFNGVLYVGDAFVPNVLNNQRFIAGYRVWSLENGMMSSDQAPFDWDYTELNGTLTSPLEPGVGESATLRLTGNGEDILFGGLDTYIFADDGSTVAGPEPVGWFSLFE